MLFGQLMPCDSLRDICLCLSKHEKILYDLGMTTSVNESTLFRANESRDYRIFEGLGQALIKIVRPMYAKQRIEYIFPQDHELFALDSTTISCSIALMGWALGKYSKGAVKMHTLIDLRGSIPAFISISDGRKHDSKVLDEIDIIRLRGYKSRKDYPKDLRLIEFCDLESGEELQFITNITDQLKLNGLEIAIIAYLLLARVKALYNSP